jgi:hypothetical protein
LGELRKREGKGQAFGLRRAGFDALSDKEIKVCYHYEFTQEVSSIRDGISRIRNEYRSFLSIFNNGLLKDKSFNLISEDPPFLIPLEYPRLFFLDYPEWPDTPYLKINPGTREKRIKTLLPDETSDEALAERLEAPEGIRNLRSGLKSKLQFRFFILINN